MDALRDSVFTCIYKNVDGNLTKVIDYSALSLEELASELNSKGEKVIFVGDAVYKHKNYFEENINNAVFAPNHLNLIKASSLGELGMIELKNGNFDDKNSAPLYLKKPQAVRELEQRLAMKNENRL